MREADDEEQHNLLRADRTANEPVSPSRPSTDTSPHNSRFHEALSSDGASVASDDYEPAGRSKYTGNILVNICRRFYEFLQGPKQPIAPNNTPFLVSAQERLRSIIGSRSTRVRRIFWGCFYAVWLLLIGSLIYRSSFAAASLKLPTSDGEPDPPQFLRCTSTLWARKNGCGVDGIDCEPFSGTSFEFRCPAGCLGTWLLNPYPVGNQSTVGQPLVIGGPVTTPALLPRQDVVLDENIYRADSMVCASAIHAGIINNRLGGCGTLMTLGGQSSFSAVSRHGISSIPFDSPFPKSFGFVKQEENGTPRSGCVDARWFITFVHIIITILFTLFQESGFQFYWVLFNAAFWQVALVSSPPPLTSWALLSRGAEGFLPASFVAYATWRSAARHTLADPTWPFDRLCWLGGLWIGILMDYITANIPVSRLIASDIQRDGGLFWVLGIAGAILIIVFCQMYKFRRLQKLPFYLACYLTTGLIFAVLAILPHMTFRLHHYIFAMLFLPGTCMQTRWDMLYQGILLGLFCDGIGRWGFDAIIQTNGDLRGDALLESVVPTFLNNGTLHDSTIVLTKALKRGVLVWRADAPANYGFSLLINDVERYRGSATRFAVQALDLTPGVPYYARLAYAYGSTALDYTKAAVFYANGTFVSPAPGRT